MVVRELTGDVYFGTPKGIDVVDGTFLAINFNFYILFRDANILNHALSFVLPNTGQRVGYNNMIYHEYEIERIARVAGEFYSSMMIYLGNQMIVHILYVGLVNMASATLCYID